MARRAGERFIALHMGGLGDRIYGVWDLAGRAWHSPGKLTDDEAEARATQLNAEYTMVGRRPTADARHVDPARAVVVLGWLPERGSLDCWIRQTDGWYGHVHIAGREPKWYPAERLRAAES